MSDAYGNIIPARWIMPWKSPKVEQLILVNWLELELPRPSPLYGLEQLRNWRNREVYTCIKDWDWTASLFPSPTLHEYECPSVVFSKLRLKRYRSYRRHVPLISGQH